jgi:hypothetical protein
LGGGILECAPGNLFNDLLFSHFSTTSAGTTLEVNPGVMKLKREIKGETTKPSTELNPNFVQQIPNRLNELERMVAKLNKKPEK